MALFVFLGLIVAFGPVVDWSWAPGGSVVPAGRMLDAQASAYQLQAQPTPQDSL